MLIRIKHHFHLVLNLSVKIYMFVTRLNRKYYFIDSRIIVSYL